MLTEFSEDFDSVDQSVIVKLLENMEEVVAVRSIKGHSTFFIADDTIIIGDNLLFEELLILKFQDISRRKCVSSEEFNDTISVDQIFSQGLSEQTIIDT